MNIFLLSTNRIIWCGDCEKLAPEYEKLAPEYEQLQEAFTDVSMRDIVEIEAEADAVKRVTETVCPLKIVLDRVVLTSTGVLLGLWQVESGTDPADIRSRLGALPRAPQKQLYDQVKVHFYSSSVRSQMKLSVNAQQGYERRNFSFKWQLENSLE